MSDVAGPSVLGRPWVRRSAAVVLALVLLSPLFAWGASAVGYAEPLDVAADLAGATSDERPGVTGVLPEYTVPGAGVYAGTLVSGLVGTGVTLLVALALGRVLRQ